MSVMKQERAYGTEVLDVVGDRIRILVDSNMTGGKCVVFECVSQPGGGPPLHRHERDDEYFYVVEGKMKFVVDGKTILANAGENAFAPRGSTHAFCNVGDTPSRMIITCTPGGLENCFREVHARSASASPTMDMLVEAFGKFDLTFHGPPLTIE